MRPHTLLRVADVAALVPETPSPPWVGARLALAPWVVVRRAPVRGALLPVGVRGAHRAERCGAWLPRAAVLESLTPRQLAGRRATYERSRTMPALAALDEVARLLAGFGLGASWGPTGAAGFELATGLACVRAESDLDLILAPEAPFAPAVAAALTAQLAQLPARIDALIESGAGAVALADYARGEPPYLLRTVNGPQLTADPWGPVAAAA
jgi:phosphoribosyl-dephospho-CoA transferase